MQFRASTCVIYFRRIPLIVTHRKVWIYVGSQSWHSTSTEEAHITSYSSLASTRPKVPAKPRKKTDGSAEHAELQKDKVSVSIRLPEVCPLMTYRALFSFSLFWDLAAIAVNA